MPQKAMKVVVELRVRAVTCPGVHLTAKDDVYLNVCLMNQFRKTERLPAIFPLLLQEKMTFEKIFWHVADPGAVSKILEYETVVVELIQLIPPMGECLAFYEKDVRSFLFPEPKLVPSSSGLGREVLMTRGPAFPGICPRLEFTTRTTIIECSANSAEISNASMPLVLTHKKSKKSKRQGRLSSLQRLSSCSPTRLRGQQIQKRALSAGPSLSPMCPQGPSLFEGFYSGSHRVAQQRPGSSLTVHSPESVCENCEQWQGEGQHSTSRFSPGMLRTNRRTISLLTSEAPQKPEEHCFRTFKRTCSSGWTPDEESWSSDTEEHAIDSQPRAYRPSPGLCRSLLSSQNVWENVQERLHALLASPKAVHRLASISAKNGVGTHLSTVPPQHACLMPLELHPPSCPTNPCRWAEPDPRLLPTNEGDRKSRGCAITVEARTTSAPAVPTVEPNHNHR
ncbi:spermatogenesis associated 6-like protein isoform X2 [Denticeps clupeoides]|uniref:spermatogenesis associated 6-like protein isoform X2 n=1 Tax=Denticeps clupeoides TaxID=299321 RepID=UPI0010A35C26|nr:spermatogenesis associated 6-like protein isoform X2 [Denticeps clupeoides]